MSAALEATYTGRNPVDLQLYSVVDAANYFRIHVAEVCALMGWESTYDFDFYYRRLGHAIPAMPLYGHTSRVLTFRNLADIFVGSGLVRGQEDRLTSAWRVRELKQRFPEITLVGSGELEEVLSHAVRWMINQDSQRRDPEERIKKAKLLLMEFRGRIELDEDGSPARLFPFTGADLYNAARFVAIDPCVRFGQPALSERGVPTGDLFDRHQGGDSIAEIAADFDLSIEEVEDAIRFEAGVRFCQC
ncbi:MAG: DUF433 domain-containing protein [Fimbriiglobus sp.]|jgi:uncharacterized protein (DUF433 family)|nr:DUF433 domain-containing protein [Fimbriiglobus sp.]